MTPTPLPLNGAPELLPCPFCGGAGRYVKHQAGIRGTMGFDSWDAVACGSCGGTVGASDRRFRDKDEARKAWNRRAAIQQAAGAVPEGVGVDGRPASKTERQLRRMLCAQRHGARAYMDDGEASWGGDEHQRPTDYLRETPEQIEDAWRKAGLSKLAASPTVQPDSGHLGAGGWIVEYSNDTGPDDEYFREWWEVTNGYATYTAHTKESAEQLCGILNAIPSGSATREDGHGS